MQTFLPYPGFARSAEVLDQARLGKQRVETLQILRALLIPDYGWRQHPAVRMWMGHTPALTQYGLAMVDEWTGRGHADTTRRLIREFTPGLTPRTTVPMPRWLGDPDVHRSHQSNLILKSPGDYKARFPGVPEDLPYLWPEPDEVILPAEPPGGIWVWRARSAGAWDRLTMPSAPPNGRSTAKWKRQLDAFTGTLVAGDAVAVTDAAGELFRTGTAGPLAADDGGAVFRRFHPDGELLRSDFDNPALLQDPRTLFRVPGPSEGPRRVQAYYGD